MTRRRAPAPRSRGVLPSSGGVADAVGHCLLIFAFLPPLAALPGWIAREVANPFNLEDPIVLAFLPMRAGVLLVNAFFDGVFQGVVSGLVAGVLFAVALRVGLPATTFRERIVLGTCTGALAATIMLGPFVAVVGGTLAAGPVAFEIATGALCGACAAPGALGFLRGRAESPGTAALDGRTA